MTKDGVTRRGVVVGGTALGAAALVPARSLAQATTAAPTADPAPATLPQRGEFVVRGARVLTMDPALPDLDSGDVHVRDGAIVAVGQNLAAPGAEVIEGRGMICMPGFVETHWHLWTTCLRPVLRADDARYTYFPVTNKLGQHYTPEDSYRSVRHGLAEALFSGITTVHNWAHNVRSPAHADAEMRAMRDTGVRGRFAYGTPQGGDNTKPMDLVDLARAKRDWTGEGSLVTLGICSRNVGSDANPLRGAVSPAIAKQEWGGARDLGLGITLHTSSGSPVKLLEDNGLLGPDVQLVHPLLTTPEDRAILKARGTSYSTSPLGESQRSAKVGVIQLAELLQDGVKVSMSVDHTAGYNCDCFACMRTLYSLNLHRKADDFKIPTKRLVQLATIDGANDLGLGDKVGSLTPGKRADLILIRTDHPNMTGYGDPYDALVLLAQPGNVDTVVVDGRILRRGGRYTALDLEKVVRDSAQTADALRARAGWP